MSLLNEAERQLSGVEIESVWCGPHSWNFRFSGGDLEVLHAWRLLRDGLLIVSSREHGLTYGEPAAVDAETQAREGLVGRRVLRAFIDPETADLKISVQGNVRLDVLSLDSRTVAWELDVGGRLTSASQGRLSNPGWFLASSPEA